MTALSIAWSQTVDWTQSIKTVVDYYDGRPDLKYGPAQENKAGPLLDMLCGLKCASRAHLRHSLSLAKDDAIATILSNVTMALQEGSVLPPEDGGWYVPVVDPTVYIVAPGFAAAWIAYRRGN